MTKNGDRYTFTFKGPGKEEGADGTLSGEWPVDDLLTDHKLTLCFIRAS